MCPLVKRWLTERMWRSPLDRTRTKSCGKGEAGETLYFNACGDRHWGCDARRRRARSAPLVNREEAAGILRDAVEAHFEMQVRAGRAAG